MCAIVASTEGYDIEVVKKIFINSRIRGIHAFGFSYVEQGEIKTKKYIDFNEFINDFEKTTPHSFIAHFRYSTSGDWSDLKNNQPIHSEAISLAFNGVLDMRTKKEMESEYCLNMNTENDGEIMIFKISASVEDSIKFINEKNRTFAGVFIDNTGKISALRNDKRPLYKSTRGGVTMYASTKDIFLRSGVNDCILIQPNKLYS